ncbi:MAG: protein kinase [Myxococcaceae bacterium]|nr:protein kinase [Myxococcaceae bacterium]
MSVSEAQEDVTAETSPEGLDPLIGVTLDGRYRIVGGLGKGAMGRVYRAVQVGLNRAVALKVLDSNYGAGRDESFRQRFLVEAALTAKLGHPNTVRIFDYGCSPDGIFYLAMEFLEGEPLDRVLAKGPLGWRRVLSMGQQVARALREAHELGVVHRDLKPANIMVLSADDDADHVKVLDFGLVKSFVEGQELEGRAITQQGMLMGSPPYMAPEQGDRNRADPRSDVYSLGCILFECLTGKPPFSGSSPLEIILKHVNEPVPPVVTPPNFEPIPDGMSAIVARCLQKSPMDRFQSMDEVLQAMSELAVPVATPPTDTPATLPPQPAAPAPSNTALLVAGFVLALFVGVGGTAVVLKWGRTEPSQQPVRFHIETEPPGAEVSIGRVIKGTTPLEFELPAVDGRAQAEVTLRKDGFLPMTVTAAGSGPRIELSQKLQPLPDEPADRGRPPKPGADKPTDKATPRAPPQSELPAERPSRPPAERVTPTERQSIDDAFEAPTPRAGPRPARRTPKPTTPTKTPPASRLDDDDEPLAPSTPPPANDLKRPR